jgi:hypothetical protein
LTHSVTSCSKRRIFTGGNGGNGGLVPAKRSGDGASRGFIQGSFKEFKVEPMSGSKIPPIDTLCDLLFKI